jgi:hypothetical protein
MHGGAGNNGLLLCWDMDNFGTKDDCANVYSTIVATLHNKSTALTPALATEAASQAYLTLDLKTKTFLVVQGLHQWV